MGEQEIFQIKSKGPGYGPEPLEVCPQLRD